MYRESTAINHHGLIFHKAPSARASEDVATDENQIVDFGAYFFPGSDLFFIPTPNDLDGESERRFEGTITPVSDLPDIGVWATRFITSALEVLSGNRPIAQLSRWCSREVFTYLIENTNIKKQIPRIGKLHIGAPTNECAEVVLLLHSPIRKRALMARFEAINDRWLCVYLFII